MIKDNLAWAFLLTLPLTGPAIILGFQLQWKEWKARKLVELVSSMDGEELLKNYNKASCTGLDVVLKHKYLPIKFKVCNEIWIYTIQQVASMKGVNLNEI